MARRRPTPGAFDPHWRPQQPRGYEPKPRDPLDRPAAEISELLGGRPTTTKGYAFALPCPIPIAPDFAHEILIRDNRATGILKVRCLDHHASSNVKDWMRKVLAEKAKTS